MFVFDEKNVGYELIFLLGGQPLFDIICFFLFLTLSFSRDKTEKDWIHFKIRPDWLTAGFYTQLKCDIVLHICYFLSRFSLGEPSKYIKWQHWGQFQRDGGEGDLFVLMAPHCGVEAG